MRVKFSALHSSSKADVTMKLIVRFVDVRFSEGVGSLWIGSIIASVYTLLMGSWAVTNPAITN